MKTAVNKYNRSFFASLLVHGILLFFLVFSLNTGYQGEKAPSHPQDIVQAVVIDEVQVAETVSRLKIEENQKQHALEEKQKQLDTKLEQVKQERVKEQAKLEKLKQDMAKAKQEEQERLADIKIAKEKEQKQLEKLKMEKEKEKKQLAALDDEREVEQDRVKQLRNERETEEKKRAAAKQQLEAKKKAEDAKRLAAAKAAKDAARIAAEKQALVTSEAQRVVAGWAGKIRENKREAYGMPTDLFCKLAVTILPDGSVQVRLLQSSGNSVYDKLSMNAVYKSQPFPLPENASVREVVKSFEIGLRNDEG